jgi:hypothetical protein
LIAIVVFSYQGFAIAQRRPVRRSKPWLKVALGITNFSLSPNIRKIVQKHKIKP